MEKFNKNHRVSVTILDETEDTNYVYLPEKRGLFNRLIRREDIYLRVWIDDFIPWDGILNNKTHYRKGNQIFIRPKVVIEYCNGQTEMRFFKSKQERDNFVALEFSGTNWTRD
jgi:hypothetical protein